jgi:hypothetical protein
MRYALCTPSAYTSRMSENSEFEEARDKAAIIIVSDFV